MIPQNTLHRRNDASRAYVFCPESVLKIPSAASKHPEDTLKTNRVARK